MVRSQETHRTRESLWARTIWLALICCVALITLHGTYADEPTKARPRWAIIATEPSATALAEMLMVSLSSWDQIELVERTEIKLLLDELKLSNAGLADAEQMLKLGRLHHADALLLIDVPSDDEEHPSAQKAPTSNPASLRLRLVATRSSVRLLDVMLPVEKLEQEAQAAAQVLRTAADKLTLAEGQLQYLGVMSIKSGEPGEMLTPYCEKLTTLVESQLHRVPSIVVLERSDLNRLRSENLVSGLELNLRASARLLEVGVRRADGGAGMVATCRVHSLTGQAVATFEITTNSNDVLAMRSAIVDKVVEQLRAIPISTASIEPEVEALAFDQRRQWFRNAYRFKEAAEMAEAALALAPTTDRIQAAISNYESYRHQFTNSGKKPPETLRLDELRVQQREMYQRLSMQNQRPKTNLSVVNDFFANRQFRISTTSEKDKADFNELRRECQQAFVELTHEAKDRPQELFDLLLDNLELLRSLSGTDEQFVSDLPGLIDRLIKTRQTAQIPQDISRPSYARFVILLLSQLDRARSIVISQSRRPDTRDHWKKQGLEQLDNRLQGDDKELALRVAKLSQKSMAGSEQVESAFQLLLLIQSWDVPKPPLAFTRKGYPREREAGRAHYRHNDVKTHQFTFDLAQRVLVACLRAQKSSELLELFLSQAERDHDASAILRHTPSFDALFNSMKSEQKVSFATRIFAVLDFAKEDEVEQAYLYRSRINRILQDNRLAPRPIFSLDDAPGAWQTYTVRGIELKNLPKDNNQLLWIDVDPRNEDRIHGDSIVMGWTRNDGISI